MQPGDIVLFPFDCSYRHLVSSFKHAGVCCGEGEVVHFQSKCLAPCPPLGRGGGRMVPRDSVFGSG